MPNSLKVALVYPLTLRGIPYGVLSIAAVLQEKNIPVKVFDLDFGHDNFIDEITVWQPDIVGFSLSTPQVARGAYISARLHETLPKAFYIAGGVHPTGMPEDVIEKLKLSCVVMGEGESTILELYECIDAGKPFQGIKGIACKNNDQLVVTDPRPLIENLDQLPWPARNLINFQSYLLPPGSIRGHWLNRCTYIITGRGCPFNCIFCASHLVFGRRVRSRSNDSLIKEIEFLVKEYKVDGIQFIDDIFSISEENVIDFCKKVREHNIKLKFSCQMRVDIVTERMLAEMKSAGFIQVEMGIESGSEKVLRLLKKGTKPDQIRRAVAMVHKAGLRVGATFMIGNPGESVEELKMTEKLAEDIAPDFVDFFYITPYPGTELYDLAVKNQWLKTDKEINWLATSPMMEIVLTKDELMGWRKHLLNKFAGRNYKLYLKNPVYFFRVVSLFLLNPGPLAKSILAFLKTGNINVFSTNFLYHYRMQKVSRK